MLLQTSQRSRTIFNSNTASDIVALVNDSPLQQYEIRSDSTTSSSQASVGEVADITYVAGGSPNYVSKTTLLQQV